jgi:hypothetical protein
MNDEQRGSFWHTVEEIFYISLLLIVPVATVFWSTSCATERSRKPTYDDLLKDSGAPAPIKQEGPYAIYENSQVAGRSYNNEVLDVDLPGTLHIKNIGSKADGAGMCVMSSIEMAAIWSNMDKRWVGLRDWCAQEPGGAYPDKVAKQLDKYAKEKGITNVKDLYIQYEGTDPWPVVEAALKTGRMPCITYGYSPRYGGQSSIAHMVCAVRGASGKYGVVLDNNFPGESAYEWMEISELKRRIIHPGRTGWVFVWLAPPPPPSPRNKQ